MGAQRQEAVPGWQPWSWRLSAPRATSCPFTPSGRTRAGKLPGERKAGWRCWVEVGEHFEGGAAPHQLSSPWNHLYGGWAAGSHSTASVSACPIPGTCWAQRCPTAAAALSLEAYAHRTGEVWSISLLPGMPPAWHSLSALWVGGMDGWEDGWMDGLVGWMDGAVDSGERRPSNRLSRGSLLLQPTLHFSTSTLSLLPGSFFQSYPCPNDCFTLDTRM